MRTGTGAGEGEGKGMGQRKCCLKVDRWHHGLVLQRFAKATWRLMSWEGNEDPSLFAQRFTQIVSAAQPPADQLSQADKCPTKLPKYVQQRVGAGAQVGGPADPEWSSGPPEHQPEPSAART